MLKMNFIFKIFIIFLSISLNAQQRRSADYYAQIPEKIENEQEIRIYKGNGITNSGRIFRIFKENKTWKAELIQWFFDKQISLDEFQSVKPMVTKLKASRNFYEIFLNIEARNIGFLPKEAEYELFYRSDNYSFYDVFKKPCQSISTFDFENFDFYHHVSDEFKVMDIPHITAFTQELLPAVTKIAVSPTQEITMNK